MTREEAARILKADDVEWNEIFDSESGLLDEALDIAIKALEQQPCEDCISRQAVLDALDNHKYFKEFCEEHHIDWSVNLDMARIAINNLPSVTPKEKTGKCKDCKYFEYDSVAKVNGIPLIVAHEICSRWGDGCKTKEDGYCFLFEPQESEDKE